ncbi:MAG: shikimate kinase [Phycisphaerales bacterium]|nr:shikimate kinase [Phycisphaerales bacterium]
MNILLTGSRGSGKTSIGRIVARSLGRPLVDLDSLVLDLFQQPTVTEVWAELGEQAWRDGEMKVLKRVLLGSDQIVSLGGGVVMIPQAKQRILEAQLAGQAVLVYLDCSLETLTARLQRAQAEGDDRPSLTGADVVEEVAAVLAERKPVYEAIADWKLCSDGTSMAQAAESVIQCIISRAW